MNQDTQLIQLDETLDKENKFILSSQVANNIIGREEQDFKLSMSQSKFQDAPMINNSTNPPFQLSQTNNNSTINQNQNMSQNQTGNNLSLMGQIHSNQHYSDFLSPKYYEIDNDLNQNFSNQLDYQIGQQNNLAPFSKQQNNGIEQRHQYDPQIVSLNNLINPNNNQQFDQTYQNFLNTQSKALLGSKNFESEKINSLNCRFSEKLDKHNRVSVSSISARTNSIQIINETDEQNAKKQSHDLEQEAKSDISKNLQVNTTKGTFSIVKMALVKNFANKLIKRVRNVMFRKLTRQQFGMIDDFASDFNYYIYQQRFIYSEKTTFIKKCIYLMEQLKITEFINQFLSGNLMLMPESIFKLIWDIFIIIAIILMILIIPVCHIYDTQNVPLLRFFNSAFISIILVFELIINLNSGIFYNGITIKDRRLIIKKNFYFIAKDIIVISLYFVSQTGENNSWISLLDYCIFWKIVDLPKKISEIEQRLQISESILNWLKLLKLECLILIIAHIASCIFIRIALSEQLEGKSNWLQHYQFDDYSFSDQYLVSIYFMIITMTTTGYGDIAPFTQYERVFILIIALVSQNVVGYSISTISDIVKTQSAKKKEFKQFMKEINKDMNNRNINIQLQHKIRKYVEYLYIQNTKKSSFDTNILEILPYQLKEEVLLEINKEMISNINYLGISKFSQVSQKQITLLIKQKVYFPGEIIFKFGELNDKIYYINQGQVSLSIPVLTKIDKITSQPEMNFKFLKKQDVFGQQGFITNSQNSYTAKTSSVTVLSYISRNDFLQIIRNNSDDYEIFSEIKDKIIFSHDYSQMKLKCYSCGEFNHQLESCPYVNFNIPYNQKKSSQEERIKHSRRAQKKPFHSNYEDLRKDVIDYLNQSINSDLYSIIQQSIIHPEELKTNYDIYRINTIEKQLKDTSPVSYANNFDRKHNQTTTNQSTQHQQVDFENAVNAQVKENDVIINLQNDQQVLKHTQSADGLKNNYLNKLDIIKENDDENQIRNSMIPRKKEKQTTRDLQNSQENELQLPILNQGFSDINYGQTQHYEKIENILSLQNQMHKLTSLDEGIQTEKQIKKHTNDILTNSLDVGSAIQQFTNQKSKDSIQNSIDLQIMQQQQQFLRNEEKKFLQNDQGHNNSSFINNSNSNSLERNTAQGNSKSPQKVDIPLFQENQFYIEPLSGSLKKKASSQGLLFQRQAKSKKQTVTQQTNTQLPLIQLRDESCNINSEWDMSNLTPQNFSIQEQLQQRRTNRSIQSLTIVEQEIHKRIEEKKQSCKMVSKMNETFSSSLRNIPRNSLKGLTQQLIAPEFEQQQNGQIVLKQKQFVNGNLTPTVQSSIHRKDKRHATINLQEQQSTASSNKHRDSYYYGRNNTNYTYKLALQHLQPYQVQNNEQKQQEKQLPQQNTLNSNSQNAQSFMHLLTQGTQKHNPNSILGEGTRENKSKFIQFAIKENSLKKQLQSMKMIPNVESQHEIQQDQQNEIAQNNQLPPEKFHQGEQIAEDISQNVEFQIRCVKGVQDIDILVLRKIYLLAQLKNQRIEEIGEEWQEYILVEDNEIEIDALQNYKFYFPQGNFYQIKSNIRRKETKKMMKNRKSKKSQYFGGATNTQQTKYRTKNTQLV
ncbi:cyclic nucleotide-binding domain protein (macronuclear) [Tetrahymena thermophila SB210]|uniref:Cyclic nucleotide-binding domain protein n=1 Tax=Tetrahymena thermophila (strain SB210) TaxID=312017 RepID=Q22U38_TETTS|nr:cyclic nucleotide-binding domain protein [Tetrahymena thermophila SB210]EAR88849.2 cyclic nucleotide-binding domain protein [Tetrahymena thermophila SB210]|eukprot:XP_001009094.2 cyclic nucleotide-binding domain protein [Tetrahymena thermophila SB210]